MRATALRRPPIALLVAALAAGAPPRLAAQAPPSVHVSFGVDTTNGDVGAIVRLVRAYLAQPDSTAKDRGLWVRNQWGDLTRGFAYQGFPATVLGVTPTDPGDSAYVVKILYARADGASGAVRALALQRLYAVRAGDTPYGFQLSTALPRLTRDWLRRPWPRIVYHYAPGQQADLRKGDVASGFVDSVARLFAVEPPPFINYYVTASPEEYLRAIGLDFFPLPSGPGTSTGGQALPAEGIVLAGDPAQGEAYLHELTHVVLRDWPARSWIAREGVATWLAGSKGRSPRELYALLTEYQRAHPKVTLAMLVHGDVPSGWGQPETDALYASAALFVNAVNEGTGISAVRALAILPGGADSTLRAMRLSLGIDAGDATALERWWRAAAPEAARPLPPPRYVERPRAPGPVRLLVIGSFGRGQNERRDWLAATALRHAVKARAPRKRLWVIPDADVQNVLPDWIEDPDTRPDDEREMALIVRADWTVVVRADTVTGGVQLEAALRGDPRGPRRAEPYATVTARTMERAVAELARRILADRRFS